jgi:hypothetical protein
VRSLETLGSKKIYNFLKNKQSTVYVREMGAYFSTSEGPDKETLEKIKNLSELAVSSYRHVRETGTLEINSEKFPCLAVEKAKVVLSFVKKEDNEEMYYVDMKNIDRLEDRLQEKRQEAICDSYRGNFNFEIKQKALKFARRRFDTLSKVQNMCVYSPCPYTDCTSTHIPSLDEYSRNYVVSVKEAKKLEISPWVYFACRFKQDLI